MEKEKFLVNLFNKNGIRVNSFEANTLEDAECFAIAQIKASRDNTAKQTSISKATVWGCSQGKIIMYSKFKKEENL